MLRFMKSIFESEPKFLNLDRFYSDQNLFQFPFAGLGILLGRIIVEIEAHHQSTLLEFGQNLYGSPGTARRSGAVAFALHYM